MAPRIPQYEATAKLEPNNMASEAYEQAGYHGERAAEEIGRTITGMGEDYDKAQNRADQAQTAGMMADMADLTVKAHAALTDTLNKSDPSSGVNPLDKYDSDLQGQIDALGDKYTGVRTKEAFQKMSADLRMNMMDRGDQQWTAQTKDYAFQSIGALGQKLGNAATLDPTSVDTLAKQHSDMVDTYTAAHPGALSVTDTAKLKRAGAETIYNSAGIAIVNAVNSNPAAKIADVDKARATLAGDNFKNNMSPQDYERVQEDLNKANKTSGDAVSLYIDKQMPAILDQVRQFGPNDKATSFVVRSGNSARTPEQIAAAAKRVDDLNAAAAEFKVKKDIGDLPQDQMLSYVQQRKADFDKAGTPGDIQAANAAYQTSLKVMKERDDAFARNPAMALLDGPYQNDKVAALYVNYQKNPTPQNFQTYAAFSEGQQARLYPGRVPSVLTDDMKRDIGNSLQAVDQTPQGALQAAGTLSNLRDTTGAYYGGAVHELLRDHIIKPGQYVAGQLIGDPKTFTMAGDVLKATSMTNDDLFRQSGITEAKADAVARAAFSSFAATFSDTVNGRQLVGNYEAALSSLLRYHGDVSTATAQSMAKSMILDRYNIRGNMRIPSNFDDMDVADGAQSVLNDIKNHNLIAPPSFSGAGGALQSDMYKADVQDFGHWSTNAKGDGAQLFDQYGQPVYEKVNGKVQTVNIAYSQLEQLGKGNRGVMNNLNSIAHPERIQSKPGDLLGRIEDAGKLIAGSDPTL